MVFVQSFGEGKGRSPWLLNLDAGFDLLEALDVLLVGQDLGIWRVYLHLLGDHLVGFGELPHFENNIFYL